MTSVTVSMKMSPKQAGALYMKSIKQDERIAELEKELADYQIQGVEGFVKFCKQDPRLSGLDKLQIHSMAIAFKQALKEQGE